MLPSCFTILTGLLWMARANAISTTSTPPRPTLLLRDALTISSTSTSNIYFMTTKYNTIPGVTNAHVTQAPKTITIALPTCVQTIVPDKNGYVPPGTCNALYNYYPSFAAAVLFSILFGMLTVGHISQAAIYKKSFCWVIIMGAIWETISFVARSISTRFQQSAGVELVSDLFVLVAPLWVNAFDYMVLGRMIHFFLPAHSLFSIPASTLALLFVCLDFIAFIIQIIGGSMAGPTALPADQMKATHIYMGGIGLQQFFIFVFLGLAIKFNMEMLKMESRGRLASTKTEWRRLLYALYTSLSLITVRIFFRLIEFSAGDTSSNPLPFHESYFYILEALPMFLAILCSNIVHPGTVLIGPDSEMTSLKQTLLKRKGKVVLPKDIEENELVLMDRDQKLGGSLPRYSKLAGSSSSA